MKDALGRQIMNESVWLRTKTFSHLNDNNDADIKTTAIKRVINRKHEDYKNNFEAAQIENKKNHIEK